MTTTRNSAPRPRKTLVPDAAEVTKTCPALQARMAARRITAFMEAAMRGTGLSSPQFGLLAHIAASPEGTIGSLAERLGLDQSTLSRNLRGLERDGLVEIVVAEEDLRRRAVWLTEGGARRLEAAIPAWREAMAGLAGLIDLGRIAAVTADTAALSAGAISRTRA